jgi:hypothetical protein
MRFLLGTFCGALAMLLSAPVRAVTPPVPGTRSLGVGGALRGAATGDSALTLNPSGMSLMRAYVIEGAYAYDEAGGPESHVGRASIVDSTSGFNVAGGLYYNYLREAGHSGHEGGLALSVPMGQVVFLGGAVKYLRLAQGSFADPTKKSGFTFDAGVTVKPVGSFTIGLVGQNLVDLKTHRAPRTVGGGVTLGAVSDLLLAFDAVMRWPAAKAPDGSSGRSWTFMGGAEYLIQQQFALRAGGGHRGDTKAGYLSAGASYIAQIGAIDFGFQRDVSGSVKETLIGVSARLFLPAPE